MSEHYFSIWLFAAAILSCVKKFIQIQTATTATKLSETYK